MKLSNLSWAIIGVASLFVLVFLFAFSGFYIRAYDRGKFEEKAVHILTTFKYSENEDAVAYKSTRKYGSSIIVIKEEGENIFKYTWADGSWILTMFAEECCGDKYETHIIKSSRSTMYVTNGIHYCGFEGMGSALGNFPNEDAFIKYVVEKGEQDYTSR